METMFILSGDKHPKYSVHWQSDEFGVLLFCSKTSILYVLREWNSVSRDTVLSKFW